MDLLSAEWRTILLTLQLAAVTTAVLLALATPLAWWLAGGRPSGAARLARDAVGAVVTLPLVLPPTVLGFYLLVLLGPEGPLGMLTRALGWGVLVFTFPGLVVGSVIYSLPFVVQPLQNAFAAIGVRPMEVAATLRASPWDRFFTVALPLARPGFLTAAILGFTHTVGEFGVVLMIGGSRPGATRVLSIAVYEHVEALEYGAAHWLAGGMVAFSLAVLLALHALNRRLARAGT